ncbi:hypothetical protein LINGRAHAP2_LOCUS29311 [Linum grandiflorum]
MEIVFCETYFVIKNQQASINDLQHHLSTLTKTLTTRPPGTLPGNTEENPRGQFGALQIHHYSEWEANQSHSSSSQTSHSNATKVDSRR